MKKYTIKQRDFLNLSISLFVIVTVWIIFSIYHSYVTTTISEDLQMQITPIDPKFDTATINMLKSRQRIEPLFESTASKKQASTPATLSQTISPTPPEETITPTATEEATPTPEL